MPAPELGACFRVIGSEEAPQSLLPARDVAYCQDTRAVLLQVQMQPITCAGNTCQQLIPEYLGREISGVTALSRLYRARELEHILQGCGRFCLPGVGICNGDIPEQFACVAPQGDQAGINGDAVDIVLRDGRAAVGGAATEFFLP